jgi:MFS family permease
VGAYRSLLAGARARRLALASVLGWLGFGALSLAIVLTVQRAAGSSSAAGVALAGFALGSGVLAPARGRLVDRYGPRRALVPLAQTSGAALLGLALAAEEGAADWLLVALATLGGLTVPPLIASARVVWPQVVPPEQLPPAYGVQALLGDIGGVGGPALAGALAALASPSAALIACALLPAAGALLLARLPWPEPARREGRSGALASPGMRTLVIADFGLYAGLGALEVALPAVAAREGAAASAALPLAAFAAASAVASLVYGARPAAPGRRYVRGAVALTACCVPLAFMDTVWALAAVLVAAGAAFAAVNVAVFALLDAVAPKGTGAEALTWLTTAGAAGTALGAAGAGALAGSGRVGGALALPAVGAALATLAVLARRGTLASENGAA